MTLFLLQFIPTIIKSLAGAKDSPHPVEAFGMSINPKDNKKMLISASITLLAYYGVTVGPEWVAFLGALVPVLLGIWTAAFAISKPQTKETKT